MSQRLLARQWSDTDREPGTSLPGFFMDTTGTASRSARSTAPLDDARLNTWQASASLIPVDGAGVPGNPAPPWPDSRSFG